MNKKLFILLPAALLALTACEGFGGKDGAKSGEETSDTGSESGSGSGTSGTEVDPTDYGTAEDPLTVAEALAIAEEQCAEDGDYTRQRVYVEGVVSDRPTVSSYGWGNFHVADVGAQSSLLVWSANKTDSVSTVYQNDTIVVEGLIKKHQGVIEMSNTSQQQDYPTVIAREAGVSSITVNADEHAEVSGVQSSLGNGTTCSFTVTPASGYQINKVRLNGDDLEGSEGSYSFTVTGDSVITVTTVEEGGLVEKLAYKLDGSVLYEDDSNHTLSGYAAEGSVTQDGVEWGVTGNVTTAVSNYWRIGGKGTSAVDRPVKSKAVVSTQSITKVEVEIGTMTIGTFASLTLNVGTTAGGSETSTLTVTSPTASSKVEFEVPNAKDWSNKYFTLVFNVTPYKTSSDSGNKYVQLKAVNFYYMG